MASPAWPVTMCLAAACFGIYFFTLVPGFGSGRAYNVLDSLGRRSGHYYGYYQIVSPLIKLMVAGTHWLVSLFGVETIHSCTQIGSTDYTWSIDASEGCNPLDVLSPLWFFFAAAIIAHLWVRKCWGKILLLAAAPMVMLLVAILRLATVILIAEYANPNIAGSIYQAHSTWVALVSGISCLLVLAWLLRWVERGKKGADLGADRRGREAALRDSDTNTE